MTRPADAPRRARTPMLDHPSGGYAPGCSCHASALYASLVECPRCRHRSLEIVGDWAGCERRRCGAEFRVERIPAGHPIIPVGTMVLHP